MTKTALRAMTSTAAAIRALTRLRREKDVGVIASGSLWIDVTVRRGARSKISRNGAADMIKKFAIITTLGIALMAPVLLASAGEDEPGANGKLRGAVRQMRGRVRKGARSGRITPAEL